MENIFSSVTSIQLFTLEITMIVSKAGVKVNCLSQLSQIVRSLTLSHDSR